MAAGPEDITEQEGVSTPIVEPHGAHQYAAKEPPNPPKSLIPAVRGNLALAVRWGLLVQASGERAGTAPNPAEAQPEPAAKAAPVLSHDDDQRGGSKPARVVTADGVELAIRYWPALGPARAIVVVSHGFTASKDHPDVVALAESLQGRHLDVIAYDARGHGQSTGASTLGHLEHHDVAAAVEWAQYRHGQVVLVGASMGAIAVLSHAAIASEITGVVAVSSPADWRLPLRVRALVTAGLARTRPGRWIAEHHMSVRIHPTWIPPQTGRSLERRIETPLAIIHGQQDRLIPHTNALETSTHVKRQATIVPGMGHAFHRASHNAINDAVDWILDQSGG
jgi:pimeloyl-ACP methyl ester carboxylesterase